MSTFRLCVLKQHAPFHQNGEDKYICVHRGNAFDSRTTLAPSSIGGRYKLIIYLQNFPEMFKNNLSNISNFKFMYLHVKTQLLSFFENDGCCLALIRGHAYRHQTNFLATNCGHLMPSNLFAFSFQAQCVSLEIGILLLQLFSVL
jgi:hypothetical protein